MTSQQARLLQFIRHYQNAHRGVSPSYAEMAMGLGINSKSGIYRLLTRLEQSGEIERDHRYARAIRILKPGEAVADLQAAAQRVVEEEGVSRTYAVLRDIVAELLPRLPEAA